MTISTIKNINKRNNSTYGLCDLVTLSFRLWRQNLRLIFKTLLFPTVILSLSNSILQISIAYGLENTTNLTSTVILIILFVASVCALLGAAFITVIRVLALVRYLTGFAETFEEASQYLNKRATWLLAYFFIIGSLGFVGLCGGLALTGIASVLTATGPLGTIFGSMGIMLGILFIMLTCIVIMMISMMNLVIFACEDSNFSSILNITFNTCLKEFFPILVFTTIFYIVISAVSTPLSIPIIAASIADAVSSQIQEGGSFSETYKMSMPIMFFVQIWEGLTGLILKPVSFICYGLLYRNIKERIDGLDLREALKAIKKLS